MAQNEQHRIKSLNYRRAIYFGTEPGMKTLAEYITIAHKKFKTIKQRTVNLPSYPIVECQYFRRDPKTSEIFIHLASYNPGERTSILAQKKKGNTADVDTLAPPDGTEFMDGDMMVLIANNHVVLCSTNAHEKTAERYMRHMIKKANIDKVCDNFSLEKVSDINKLKLIQSQGVKSVTLDASIFDASLERSERESITSKISGSLMDEVKALIQQDLGKDKIDQTENLSARIVLSFDSRKKKAKIGREALTSMAQKIISEDEDGFTIETLGGERIRQNQIAVRKTVQIPKHGKSIVRNSAFRELRQYFLELKANGTLEQ